MLRKNKMFRKIIIGIVAFILMLIVVTFVYINDYYEASDYVEELILMNAERIDVIDQFTIIHAEKESDIGLIFYPGGKVEASAYMPLLIKLSDQGITSVLVEMPGNLAVLDINAADDVYDLLPHIDTWYMSGHSLGGAMASQYMKKNASLFEGLILLGAYPVNDADVNTLVIYGTYDVKLNLEKVQLANEIFEIEGGNHAYFGDYGEQKGDGEAIISRLIQQEQTIDKILKFVD